MTTRQQEAQFGQRDPKRAAMSGWIGSALEYYDFALYSTAAALVFPTIFFTSDNPTVALIASLATYAVGYVARPIGAVVLGGYGDRHGRKNVLVVAMLMMGFSTFAVGLLPTYQQVGVLAPTLSGDPAPDPGLRGRRRTRWLKRDDRRARAGRPTRVLRQLQSAGHPGRFDSRHRGDAAAGHPAAHRGLAELGVADPVPAQRGRDRRRLRHPQAGSGAPGLPGQAGGRTEEEAVPAGRTAAHPSKDPGALHPDDPDQCRRHDHSRLRHLVRHQQGLRNRLLLRRHAVGLADRQRSRGDHHPDLRRPVRPVRSPGVHDHRRPGRWRYSPASTCLPCSRRTWPW